MKSQLYFGGLPTGPQVRKLEEKFPDLKSLRGTIITHEEVAAAIGEDPKSNRYRTITMAWRRLVEKKTTVILDARGEAQGVGFLVLCPGDHQKASLNDAASGKRKYRRSHIRMANLDDDELTPEERLTKQHHLMAMGRIYAAVMETRRPVKQIQPPEGQPKKAAVQ